MNRVYVRGVGALSPLGRTWPETLAALAEGRSAVAPITRFDARGFPCRVAAAVEDTPDLVADGAQTEDRRLLLAVRAAREAWGSGLPGRLGIFIGAESGRASLATVLALSRAAGGGKTFDHAQFGDKARALAARLDARAVSPAAVASALAAELGAEGPVVTVSLACASGSAAVVEAARAIRAGACQVALCGGVGADVDPLMLAGFGLLGALSGKGVSCPFDAHRDGFVVGEGAAMLVLSGERGGSDVELAGVGRTLDAHHLTAPDPEGEGAYRAMATALADAGGASVGYVQAHGTSTPLNDAVEAAAIRRLLGDGDGYRVSSVKGALGHWVAGAGAIGLLCAVEAVRSGTIVPTANLQAPDPRCPLPHVMGGAVTANVEAALANSFAFGGANSSILVRRCG